MRKMLRGQAGYTLLEVIIVLVSIGILLTIVFFFSD